MQKLQCYQAPHLRRTKKGSTNIRFHQLQQTQHKKRTITMEGHSPSTMLSHYTCSCGFGRKARKTDESVINHVRACHGIDICVRAPYFECHFDHKRLLNMHAVQEHLLVEHGIVLEKHYFDIHHHEVTPPPVAPADSEAPCEPSAAAST